MNDQSEADDCHDSEGLPDRDSSGCDAGSEVWISCCDAPVDQELAEVDFASPWDHSLTELVLQDEQVHVQPPSRPPDLISQAISTQQHEVGRFTLLSSFLI
jgi:hypothetical protein